MRSKRSHHLITLLMLIGVPIQQRLSLQRWHWLTMQLILWLIKTLSCRKMVRRICEITVALDFIFRLVLYGHEDVSFNVIFLNVLEGIKQFHLSMWFKKNQLETPFKGENVKALKKRQIVKTWSFIYLRQFRKLQNLLCFLGFSDQTIA